MKADLDRLERRVQNVAHLCQLTAPPVQESGAPKLQMAADPARTFDSVPYAQHFGFASCLPADTQIVRISLNCDPSSGIAIASLHLPSLPAGLLQGQSVQYDAIGSAILMDNAGNVVITPKGGKLIVRGDMELDGNLVVSGTIAATGEITALQGGAAVKLSTHTHTGVQPGTGASGAPTPGS